MTLLPFGRHDRGESAVGRAIIVNRRRLLRERALYPESHRALRRRLAPIVASGMVRCARGAQCKFADGELGGFIGRGEKWDLGHKDGGGPGEYAGPEHVLCNRSTGGARRTRSTTSRNWLPA